MPILFRHSFKTAINSRFLNVAIATSNFMDEVCNGGFAPKLSVSMLSWWFQKKPSRQFEIMYMKLRNKKQN